jgi:riboflavin kinase/FMN adenylyltransferase
VVIGNFDGVHRGHVAVLREAVAEAAKHGLEPLLLTFDPHPAVVLHDIPSRVLTTMDRRVELVTRVDARLRVVVEPFTRELAELEPRAFVEELLLENLGARRVVVGQNFCFGRGRSGDVGTLAALGRELGFEARALALVGDDQGTYSSSRARAAIAGGHLPEAERVLGRPHAISGVVEHGEARGRSIGFATANLGSVPELMPPDGVYACLVDRLFDDGRVEVLGRAVANHGVRPTLAAGRAFEAHLLDFEGDLYGQRLRVHLVERLREERHFGGLDALRAQIAADVAAARQALAARRPDPAAGGAWH